MKINLLFLLALIFVTACTTNQDKVIDISPKFDCTSDIDCTPAGCSSQLCVTKEVAPIIVTTCEYKEEFECLKLTSCGCVNNKCQWAENQEYQECLNNL